MLLGCVVKVAAKFLPFDDSKSRVQCVQFGNLDVLGILIGSFAIGKCGAAAEVVSLSEGFDMTTPGGRLQFGLFSSFAAFERELIRERVRAGLARAKSLGHLPGRKRQSLDLPAVRTRMANGESLRKVAASLGISAALLSRRLKESHRGL
jgi:hypothetical protein